MIIVIVLGWGLRAVGSRANESVVGVGCRAWSNNTHPTAFWIQNLKLASAHMHSKKIFVTAGEHVTSDDMFNV
jgi:hypothetical protein